MKGLKLRSETWIFCWLLFLLSTAHGQSAFNLDSLLKSIEHISPYEQANVLKHASQNLADQGEIEQAISLSDIAEQRIEKIRRRKPTWENIRLYCDIVVHQAELYFNDEQYDGAEISYTRALTCAEQELPTYDTMNKIDRERENIILRKDLRIKLAQVQTIKKNYEDALALLEEVDDLAGLLDDFKTMGFVDRAQGNRREKGEIKRSL